MIKVIFIALGVVLLVAGAGVGLSVRRFTDKATEAEGVVIRLNAGGSHPQIAFVTAAGKTVSYPQGGLVFGARPGDKFRVLYLPEDPVSTARVDTFGSLWFVPLLLLVLGLGFLVRGATTKTTKAEPTITSAGG